MTNPSVLLELAGRVEALTGRDMRVGREVLIACGWVNSSRGYFMGPMYGWRSPDFKVSFDDDDFRLHDPTTSLDAAMSLIDSNIPAHVLRDAMSSLADRFRLHVTFWPADQSYTECLARFVTAACLRALAAREG